MNIWNFIVSHCYLPIIGAVGIGIIAAIVKRSLPKLAEDLIRDLIRQKFQKNLKSYQKDLDKELESYKKDLDKELAKHQSAIDAYYNYELEKHKHELQKVVEDRKIVLSLLYQKRMEALLQINQAIYDFTVLCGSYMSLPPFSGEVFKVVY